MLGTSISPPKAAPGHGDWDAAEQVGAVALEELVWLDVDHDVEIAALSSAQACFAFAGQADAASGFDTGGDFDLEGLAFMDAARAVTFFTGVFDERAFAVAGGAGAFYREEALLLADAALPVAGGALLGFRPFFRPPSLRSLHRRR